MLRYLFLHLLRNINVCFSIGTLKTMGNFWRTHHSNLFHNSVETHIKISQKEGRRIRWIREIKERNFLLFYLESKRASFTESF